jgi:hypothetical protein
MGGSSCLRRRRAYRVLVGKSEGKVYLERCRRRWMENTKMNVLDTGRGDVDCIHLVNDRLVHSMSFLNIRVV